jgi:hypothetical protein
VRRICGADCAEDRLPLLQQLVGQHIDEQGTQMAQPLDPSICWDAMPSPRISGEHSIASNAMPKTVSQRRMHLSTSSATLASSTTAQSFSSSCPSHMNLQAMQRTLRNVAPEVIDSTPSTNVPPLLSPLSPTQLQQMRESAMRTDLRKVMSCTALSTYPALPAASPLPGVPEADPCHLTRNSCPASSDHLPVISPHGAPRATAPALTACAPAARDSLEALPALQPRTSLLTLAEAQTDAIDCPDEGLHRRMPGGYRFVAASPRRVEAAMARQRRSTSSGASPLGQHAHRGGVAAAQAGFGAESMRRRAPEDTPFTRLQGLPAALHREATSCGFHKPVRVKVATGAVAHGNRRPCKPRYKRAGTPHASQAARRRSHGGVEGLADMD